MKSIVKTLKNAIGTGELINIVYQGGSQPGKARMILPLKIKGDKVLAKCLSTNKIKLYFLDKASLAKLDTVDYRAGSLIKRASNAVSVGGLKKMGFDLPTVMVITGALVVAGAVAGLAFGLFKKKGKVEME